MELWPWVPRLRQADVKVAWWASFRRVFREYFIRDFEFRDFRVRFESILDDLILFSDFIPYFLYILALTFIVHSPGHNLSKYYFYVQN